MGGVTVDTQLSARLCCELRGGGSHTAPEKGDGSWRHSEQRGHPPPSPRGSSLTPTPRTWGLRNPLSWVVPPQAVGTQGPRDLGGGRTALCRGMDGRWGGGVTHLEVPVDDPHLVTVEDSLQDRSAGCSGCVQTSRGGSGARCPHHHHHLLHPPRLGAPGTCAPPQTSPLPRCPHRAAPWGGWDPTKTSSDLTLRGGC